MIGYVTIGAVDVEKAMPFYDAVLGAIGSERQFFDGGWAGYGLKGQDATTFICPPFDGQAARGGNGVMIAFKGESREAVQAAHAAALAQGGVDVTVGVLEQECRDAIADFVVWKTKDRPFVTVKLAMTSGRSRK